MKTLYRPWFIFSCLLWLLVFVSRRYGHPIYYLNDHFTDLLAVPVIANIALAFQRSAVIRSGSYCFKAGHVIFIVVYLSVVFELILPRFSKQYTADLTDVLMYVTGGLIFYYKLNHSLKQPVKQDISG